MHPSLLQKVMETICIIFSKKPSIENFFKLASDWNKFIETIVSYNLNGTSDYVSNMIKAYCNDENFNNDSIKKLNDFCSILSTWIRLIYEYYLISGEQSNIESDSNLFKKYLIDNSFYMFPWIAYIHTESINNMSDEMCRKINSISRSIDNLEIDPIMTIDDFYLRVENDENVKKNLLSKKISLPEVYAKAEAAKGNYYFDRDTHFIITDLKLMADLLEVISGSCLSSIKIDTLSEIIGEQTPLWKLNDLLDKFKSKTKSVTIIKRFFL